ncbi:MAG TPA: hypothetical protein PKI55_03260 [Chitinophagaceae bacterium]|nr:hypothetical protein [Chitinophagaceae bacterium]
MKKIFFFFLTGFLLLNVYGMAKEKLSTISPEAKALSEDDQFVKMINSIFNFSADIYLHKKQDALTRLSGNVASEQDVKDIVGATSIKDKNELYILFNQISEYRKNINGRYPFIAKEQNRISIFKEAVLEITKNGKLPGFKNVDVDCLASVMGMFGLCYWMMEECNIINNNQGSGSQYDNCVIAVTACLAQAFIASDQCFNLGILPF